MDRYNKHKVYTKRYLTVKVQLETVPPSEDSGSPWPDIRVTVWFFGVRIFSHTFIL